ncbi:MAG TPA: LLM class flavin-dependent oxidoreductase [Afipia sp.]
MATRSDKMNLAAFVAAGPVSGSHGGWRFPSADRNFLNASYYTNIGRLLEQARFDLMFIADVLAIPTRFEGSYDSQLRYGALGAMRLDPIVVLSLLSGSTTRLGLAATISTTYFEPFGIARAMATLDHLSEGRAAWNIVTSVQEAEARNFSRTKHPSHEERYDRADEFLDVACKLWDSWNDGALVLDTKTPIFADPAQVHPINHKGRWFEVDGPLNVPRSPQGRPVFIQAGASDRGRDFAARWAEIIFVTHASLDSAKSFYRDMKERIAKAGRDPSRVKILPGIRPIVGETRTIVDEIVKVIDGLVEPKAGLSTLAYHLDIDLSKYPQDEVLPIISDPGIAGHYKEVAELTQKQGLSLAEIGKRYGQGLLRDFVGTADEVTDRIETWFSQEACDGFMVQAPYFPGALEAFAQLVIPRLQDRNLFRREYEGTTLRDHLGLVRPAIS